MSIFNIEQLKKIAQMKIFTKCVPNDIINVMRPNYEDVAYLNQFGYIYIMKNEDDRHKMRKFVCNCYFDDDSWRDYLLNFIEEKELGSCFGIAYREVEPEKYGNLDFFTIDDLDEAIYEYERDSKTNIEDACEIRNFAGNMDLENSKS